MRTSKKGEWLEITVHKDWNGLTPESILKEIWQVPKGLMHQWRMENGLKVNGELVPWKTVLSEGDRFQIHLFQDEDFGVQPEYLPLEVVFEDDHLLIVNKPPGMDTHPTDNVTTGTLSQAVAFYWQMNGIFRKVRHIHRLDRDTSGGLIFAKHAFAGARLDQLLQKREINRTYIAFVQGLFQEQKGEVDLPIGRDRHHPTKRRVSSTGVPAITNYQVLAGSRKHHVSLVELKLQTGRTHQIRVHMSHIGHPVIGDALYGGQAQYISRQALHAANITLTHPISGDLLEVDIPWPKDLTSLKEHFSL